MAEPIQYQELVPGLRHFECTRQRALISTATCSARYAAAQRDREDERLDLCRRCPIGAVHAAPPATSAAYVHDNELINVDHPKRCIRCGTVATRIIGKKFCPSCFNRWREFERGVNGKGTAPITFIPPVPRRVGIMLETGRRGFVWENGQNESEPLASFIRFRPGVKFHGDRPGRVHWNAESEAFEYRDEAGHVLLELKDGGELHYIAVDRLHPGETPAPVLAGTQLMPAPVVATWLRLTARDELSPEWRPTEFVCGDCRRAQIMARNRDGRVSTECRACGASARE